jgi:hypothetical protein
VRLVRATQTSVACPSQWDAYDEDGNYWYLRYRHGLGAAYRFLGPDWEYYSQAIDEYRFAHGHDLDGYITLEEFALRAGFGLASELREVGFTQYMANELDRRGAPTEIIEALGLPEPRENDE